MSHRAFLVATRAEILGPFCRDDWKDFEMLEIGNCSYSIPIPWLAMFREGDLREESISFEDGETYRAFAPVVTREGALRNLEEAVSPIRLAFPEIPVLADYLRLMREEIATFDWPFFTIDFIDIELMAGGDGDGFMRDPLRQALRGFTDPTIVTTFPKTPSFVQRLLGRTPPPRVETWRDTLASLSAMDLRKPFPKPEEVAANPRGDHDNFYLQLPGGESHTSVWQAR